MNWRRSAAPDRRRMAEARAHLADVHLHFLVTEGGVDEAGVFHKIPRIDDSRLAEIFTREVLAMLVRKAGAAGFLVLTRSSSADLCDFSRLLTEPPGPR